MNLKTKVLLIFGVLLFGFYSYQVATDFVLINKYVWNRSIELSTLRKVGKTDIHGTNAWKLNYRNPKREYKYIFSYDSPERNPDFRNEYELVEIKDITYPLNIFVKPKIFLYKPL